MPRSVARRGRGLRARADNIVRWQLKPSEEATAVRAMLDRGLTEDGAAQALGWARQRTQREDQGLGADLAEGGPSSINTAAVGAV